MPATETLIPPPTIAEAFNRIAQLRRAGYDLVWTEQPNELARLIRGRELIIVPVQSDVRGAPWN